MADTRTPRNNATREKETRRKHLIDLNMNLLILSVMNIYLFLILFLALWATVPLMIIKGKSDKSPKVMTSPEVKKKNKGWFN